MLIFKDILNGDEMFSDAYDMKLVDDIVYEVEAQNIQVSTGGGDVDIGANPSAEGGDEGGAEEGTQQVNNIVYNFRLNETGFDKKSYMSHLKGYMKSVKAKLQENGAPEEEVTAFEKGAQAQAKKIIGNFKNFEFFIGESMDIDGMVALMDYREDGVTPYFIFWKHGLKEEKC